MMKPTEFAWATFVSVAMWVPVIWMLIKLVDHITLPQ